MLNKVKNVLKNTKTKLMASLVLARALMYNAVATVHAADDFSGEAKNMAGGFNTVMGFLLTAVQTGGVFFIVIGAIAISTVIKSGEQNPDAVIGAIKNIVIGILLAATGTIIKLFVPGASISPIPIF